MAQDGNSYRQAIKDAEAERARLLEELKEFDRIKERLGQIEAFINQGRLLVGGELKDVNTHKPGSEGLGIVPFLTEKTNPEKIVEILKATGRAMTVPQIVNEFQARNWPLSEKSRMQIIRNAIKGKPDWFKKEGKGLWNLKERVT